MPLLPLWAFVACSRVTFTFTITVVSHMKKETTTCRNPVGVQYQNNLLLRYDTVYCGKVSTFQSNVLPPLSVRHRDVP